MPKRKRKVADTQSDIEPPKLKVAELKEELEKRGLDSSGKKVELVARLEDAIQGAGERDLNSLLKIYNNIIALY